MKRIFFSLIIVCISAFIGFSQDEETLLTIGNTEVSKGEFERIYKKNNSNLYDDNDKKSPKEYVDLYINFKLKVIEAEALKMDTISVFVDELAGYRKELAAPYLIDIKFNEQMVEDTYNRMTKEVNASHILIKLDKNATDKESDAILKKITKIREEIVTGKDFGKAAAEYSEDPSAKMNKGDLSYFTAFQMVTPFENTAFSIPIGEVSEPFRTSFGYHILKVHDIRKNRGEILVAHIMKMFPKGATPEIKKKLKTEIDTIYQEILSGADFAEMVKTKSDDKRSVQNDGQMPWFAAGRMIKEFADPAFELEEKGDFTKPIETKFGYHIIKLIDSREIKSFEESKSEIENKIKRDPARSITSKKAFIGKLKNEYNYSENAVGIEKLKELKIVNKSAKSDFNIFTLDDKEYGFEEFQKYIIDKKIQTETYISNIENWIDFEITKYEDSRLEEKYPEFRYLMQEYHDGILLFNISEEKIWNLAVEDSVGLKKYFKKSKKKYTWKERFKGSIIICNDIKTRDEADKYFAENIPNNEITDVINQAKKRITIEEGTWEKGSNEIIDYFVWNEKEPNNFDGKLTYLRGDKIPPEPKSLNEARGLYISDYQKYIENKWIKELRKKHKIKIKKKLLKTIDGV